MKRSLVLLELISPQCIVFSGRVRSVLLPTRDGDKAFKSGATPTRTELSPGLITAVALRGHRLEFQTRGGLAEIDGDRVTVLAH